MQRKEFGEGEGLLNAVKIRDASQVYTLHKLQNRLVTVSYNDFYKSQRR
jgi:hypothetical protein